MLSVLVCSISQEPITGLLVWKEDKQVNMVINSVRIVYSEKKPGW